MKKLLPSSFNITGDPIPEDVVDRIVEYHIEPGNRAQKKCGFDIWPSAKSGYRPEWYEESKGRSGNSQHTYKDDGKGATDWTCHQFADNKINLLDALITETDYTRIAIYDTFIHADYKGTERWVYDKNWVKQTKID
jgi:hypothetical protein